jgi:8-oxo-dGTP pyrophosphatase MutT (NUDIX family)
VSASAQPERSAGLVIARLDGWRWRLLILRAGRFWDFPRGRMDSGEDAFAAAKRAATGETGISEFAFDFGEGYKETIAYASGSVARYYIAASDTEQVTLTVSQEAGRPAQEEWRWITLDEAEDYLPPRLAVVLDWVRDTLDKD